MLLGYQESRVEKAAEWGDPRLPPALVPAAWAPSLSPPGCPMQLLAGAAAIYRPHSPARPAPPLLCQNSVTQSLQYQLFYAAIPALSCTSSDCVESLVTSSNRSCSIATQDDMHMLSMSRNIRINIRSSTRAPPLYGCDVKAPTLDTHESMSTSI